jgi:hypothetical protein
MSSCHPENDSSNPDKPGSSDEIGTAGSDTAEAKEAAATANPDPLEGSIKRYQISPSTRMMLPPVTALISSSL